MKNTLYLDSLHIKDEYKGKEVGTKIINHLKKYAREKEYKGVSVSIISGNDRVRKLYTKLGAAHLDDYNNYETKCERLYWKLFQGKGNMLGNLSLFNRIKQEKLEKVEITPELYKKHHELGLSTRFYSCKYAEYKGNIKGTFLRELDLIKELGVIPFNDEKGVERKSKYRDIIEKNLDKLILNWITFEELLFKISNDSLKSEYEKYNTEY